MVSSEEGPLLQAQNGVRIKFPQTIRRNCILFIILPPGQASGMEWNGIRLLGLSPSFLGGEIFVQSTP